jgi:hypothetical protein
LLELEFYIATKQLRAFYLSVFRPTILKAIAAGSELALFVGFGKWRF